MEGFLSITKEDCADSVAESIKEANSHVCSFVRGVKGKLNKTPTCGA